VSEPDADARESQQHVAPDVPDFDLIRPIGSGGFGEVWLATNRTTKQLRAVKVIPLHRPGNADPAAREIGSLTRLEADSRCRHPNLLQIHHVGKTATHLFYVMDPADDVSSGPASAKPDYRPATLQTMLQEWGQGDGPNLPERPSGGRTRTGSALFFPEECLDYTRQLLAGLAMLHAAGMVHRDVKPANCLFVGGQLKLGDFGLLTAAHPLVSRVGTQKYMPPDGRMDMRADVYAAGLVIYEMLSGLPVEEFPRLGGRSKQIADNATLATLLRLVLRACERESENRPPDARAMLAELATPAAPTARPFQRRLLVAAVVTAALALAGVGAWMFYEKTLTDAGQTAGNPVAAPPDNAAGDEPSRLANVSFITEPPEAKIYIDDKLLYETEPKPYRTPCTVDGLPARTCRVAFQYDREPPWGGHSYDLRQTHQIVARRP
jgi:eukaryotic-like serine/threonine-protein kinase